LSSCFSCLPLFLVFSFLSPLWTRQLVAACRTVSLEDTREMGHRELRSFFSGICGMWTESRNSGNTWHK
jgi:hypothetical protein